MNTFMINEIAVEKNASQKMTRTKLFAAKAAAALGVTAVMVALSTTVHFAVEKIAEML